MWDVLFVAWLNLGTWYYGVGRGIWGDHTVLYLLLEGGDTGS